MEHEKGSSLTSRHPVTETHSSKLAAHTQLQQTCELRFDVPTVLTRQTSIIATIGTACNNVETLMDMILAGMSIARINFSYDSYEMHQLYIANIRAASELVEKKIGYGLHVAIAMDIRGPQIRTGLLEGNKIIELKQNDFIRLSTNKDLYDKGTRECIFVDYPALINIPIGTRIFLSDGQILLSVKETAVDCIICQVEIAGLLQNNQTVNMPDVTIDLPALSEKDQFDINFAVEQKVDFILASHILNASALSQIRQMLKPKGTNIKIIAKIENRQCLEMLDDIIAQSDGILFSRIDLSIELEVEKIFLLQKAVIARCNRSAKPVIIATNLLKSMCNSERPTYTEVIDAGNAVIEGADCLMLSSETSIGKYPLECIKKLAHISKESEEAVWHRDFFNELVARNPALLDAAHAVAISAVDAAKKSLASVIIVITTSGRSAHLVSSYRPHCPVLAVSRGAQTSRQCHLHRGLIPLLYKYGAESDYIKDVDNRLNYALYVGKLMGLINMGDPVVVISPWKAGFGFTNNMRILYAFFENEPVECMFKRMKKNHMKSHSLN